jgi:hypothetical protein
VMMIVEKLVRERGIKGGGGVKGRGKKVVG